MPWTPPFSVCPISVAETSDYCFDISLCGKTLLFYPSDMICTCQNCWIKFLLVIFLDDSPGDQFYFLLTPLISYDTWVHANEIDAEIEDPPIPEKPWKVSLS